MTFNLPAFIRDGCAAAGIPGVLVGAVVHRAEMAMVAVQARGRGRTREQRIAATPREVCKRVLAQAAADYAAGTLERRVEE